MITALRFVPLIPFGFFIAIVIVAALATALALFRMARGAVLRAAAFAVLLAWLAGPVLVRETRQGLRDIALLVVDRSASMQAADRASLADRAAAALRAQAARLPDLDLRETVVPARGHNGTELWAAARQALADIPRDRLAGIVAVTDGMVHDTPPALPDGVPVHALVTAKGEQWDRRVRVVEAPAYGIVGRTLTMKVAVEDLGQGAPGGTATLRLRRDGGDTVSLEVPVGQTVTVPVEIAKAGPTVVEISTPPIPGEASPLNDSAVVQINGVRDRLRVLLVSGEPTQDERTWRRLLKSDPAVDLVHFTILRPPEKDDTTPLNELALIAFPTRELFAEKLSGFDLIVLDRFTDRGILPHVYLRNVADYVRHGGALLLTAGPEFAGPTSLDQTPLADILPAHAPLSGQGVVSEEFRPEVTALGLRHPVTAGLPGANAAPGDAPAWGSWYRIVSTEDVQGQVLMQGPNAAPLLILAHVGQGRAALLMSDQIWLWSRGHQGGGPQAELLRRIAHWLMGEPELDEDRLAATIDAGTLHVSRRSVAEGEPPPLRVTAPDDTTRSLALAATGPGAAEARLPALLPGVWRVTDGTHTAFAVSGQDNRPEYADLRATAEKLAPVSRASGGGIVWLGRNGPPTLRRTEGAGATWIGLPRRFAHVVTGVETVPLAPPWAALPLLLGFVVLAWRREAK